MAGINFKFNFGKITDLEKNMKREVVTEMNAFWNEAVIAFIDGVRDNTKIETGMSQASLIPLSEKVGYGSLWSTIKSDSKRDFAKPLYTLTGEFRKGLSRSMYRGLLAGKKAYKLKRASAKSPTLDLVFNIKVYQHAGWEPEQHSLAAGRQAMLDYMKANKGSLEKRIGRLYRKIVGSYLRGE